MKIRKDAPDILSETMSKLAWGGFTIRLWVPGICDVAEDEIATFLKATTWIGQPDAREVAMWLIRMCEVNAVEVVDQAGKGVVLYADWP